MKDIAARLEVSPSSVHLWTSDIEISSAHTARNLRRSRTRFAETWAELHRTRRRAFQQEGRARADEGDLLHQAGCMLYWAEGSKDRNTLCLANSDVHMVRLFCRFLRESLTVSAEEIRLRLNVYLGNGRTLGEIEDHWLSALDLPRSCLRGHCINHFPTSSSGRKRAKLPYGVANVRVVRSTRIVQHIFGAIQAYAEFDEPRWLDHRHASEAVRVTPGQPSDAAGCRASS